MMITMRPSCRIQLKDHDFGNDEQGGPHMVFDMAPMDVSDLSGGESVGAASAERISRRQRGGGSSSGFSSIPEEDTPPAPTAAPRRIPRKDRVARKDRISRKDRNAAARGGGGEEPNDNVAKRTSLLLRRAQTIDTPMSIRREYSPTNVNEAPLPPLRRVSTTGPVMPRPRRFKRSTTGPTKPASATEESSTPLDMISSMPYGPLAPLAPTIPQRQASINESQKDNHRGRGRRGSSSSRSGGGSTSGRRQQRSQEHHGNDMMLATLKERSGDTSPTPPSSSLSNAQIIHATAQVVMHVIQHSRSPKRRSHTTNTTRRSSRDSRSSAGSGGSGNGSSAPFPKLQHSRKKMASKTTTIATDNGTSFEFQYNTNALVDTDTDDYIGNITPNRQPMFRRTLTDGATPLNRSSDGHSHPYGCYDLHPTTTETLLAGYNNNNTSPRTSDAVVADPSFLHRNQYNIMRNVDHQSLSSGTSTTTGGDRTLEYYSNRIVLDNHDPMMMNHHNEQQQHEEPAVEEVPAYPTFRRTGTYDSLPCKPKRRTSRSRRRSKSSQHLSLDDDTKGNCRWN